MRSSLAGAGPIVRARSTARRKCSTIAPRAGRSAAYGRRYSLLWLEKPAPRIASSSTPPASRSTAAPEVEKGGLGPWYQPHKRWPRHQAPRRLRRQGPPALPDAHAGQRPRLLSCPALHRGPAAQRRSRRRQRLRQQGAARLTGRTRHQSRHPARQEPQAAVRLRQGRLQAAQHRRAHVLPPPRLAAHRHLLRPQLHQLPCSNNHRRRRHVVAQLSPDSKTSADSIWLRGKFPMGSQIIESRYSLRVAAPGYHPFTASRLCFQKYCLQSPTNASAA